LTTQTQSKSWHVASWGTLGWLETFAKGFGIIIGVIAFFFALPVEPAPLDGFANIAAAALLGFITLGVFFSILVRLYQREVISILFAIASALGHAGMSFYLLRGVETNTLPVMFGIAYAVGELIKQRFLTQTGYTELGASSSLMLLAVRGLMAAYIVFAILSALA
jgi:hypothetical protein